MDVTLLAIALAGTLLLLFSAGGHLLNRGALDAALRQQGVRVAIRGPIAVLLTAAEVTLGLAGLGTLLGIAPMRVRTGILIAIALLYFALMLWAFRTLRRTPQAPCGCGAGDHANHKWVVGRASLMVTVFAVASVQSAFGASALPEDTPSLLLVTAGSVCVATLLWILPSAMYDPWERIGGISANRAWMDGGAVFDES